MITAETLHPKYLKTLSGNPEFVILPLNEYDDLIEDYNELSVMSERVNEERISLSELKKNLYNQKNV